MELPKVQRNELYDAILLDGINPDECRLDSYRPRRFTPRYRSRITHSPSDSSFEFEASNRGAEYGGRYDIVRRRPETQTLLTEGGKQLSDT